MKYGDLLLINEINFPWTTTSVAAHKFWCAVFIITHPEYFRASSVIYSLIHDFSGSVFSYSNRAFNWYLCCDPLTSFSYFPRTWSEKLFSGFHWGFFMAWHMICLCKYSCVPEKCVHSHYYPCLSVRWSSFFVWLGSSKFADFVSDRLIIKEYMVKCWWIFPSLCEVVLSFASYLGRHFH